MLNSYRSARHILFLVKLAALVVILPTACRESPTSRRSEPWESRIFKKYVLDPIPKSVANIKVDEIEQRGLGHIYVMRFEIKRADAELICNSRPYKKSTLDTFEHDHISWRESEGQKQDLLVIDLGAGHTLSLYTNERQQNPTEWFHPRDLAGPKAYVVKEKYGRSTRYVTKIMVFDEDLEEAYFVEHLEGH